MSAALERRYARLLRLYPAGYRRGGEVLDTLMESAEDGRTRPPLREVLGLIVGALRAHAGRDVRTGWLSAFRAAALMLLVHDVADGAVRMVFELAYGPPFVWSPLNFLVLLLGAGAVFAGATDRYLSAIVAAGAAFGVSLVVTGPMAGPMYGNFWKFPLAIVLLVPLLRRRPPVATGLLRYVPVLPLLVVAVDQGLAPAFPAVTGILQRAALLALCLGALLWLAIDERVAMAVGLLMLNSLLIQLVFLGTGSIHNAMAAAVSVAVFGVAPAVLLLSSVVTARRRARL